MALPSQGDTTKLDNITWGLPYSNVDASTSVNSGTLDYPSWGLPFIGQPNTATGSVSVSVPKGTLTFTSYAPTVTATDNKTIAVPKGTLTFTGYAPTVTATGSQTVSVPKGTLTFTGYAPTVTATDNKSVAVPKGTLTFTGYDPVVTVGDAKVVQVPKGTLTFTSYAPTLDITANLTIPKGTLTFTGYAPTVTVATPVVTKDISTQKEVEYDPLIDEVVYHKHDITLSSDDVVDVVETFLPTLNSDNTFAGTNTFSGAVVLNGALSGTSIKDEDNMASDSATAVPTQQSTKAYVDNRLSATNATDLTDGGATTLHKHDHGRQDGLADDDHTQYVLRQPAADTVINESGGDFDFRIESDTEANMLKLDAGTDKLYLGGTTNGLEIEKGGKLKAIGTATWFDDLRVEPTVRGSGTKAPAYTQWTPSGGSASGIYCYLFNNAVVASEKEVNFKVQMPHGKKLDSAVHLHVHWMPTSTGSAGDKVRWGLEYTKANPNAAFSAPGAFIYATDPVSPPSTTPTVDTHYITEFADIDMTGDALSTILLCRLFRNSSDAADSFAGDVMLLYIDCHVEMSQLGSNDEYTQ